MNTEILSKAEKIDLIKKLAAGTAHVIDGNIVELFPVIIIKGDKFCMREQEFDNLEDISKLFPEGQTLIILPEKGDEPDN